MKIKYAVISKKGRRSDNEDFAKVVNKPEEILDVYDFLCEKNGDDNYTAILAFVE